MTGLGVAEKKAEYLPRNYRIISHRTQRRIFHIEDALELERLRMEIWDYSKGSGAKGNVEAYVDVHTARLLASELVAGCLDEMDGHQQMGGGVVQGEVTSRILHTENTDTKNPIRITIRNGPGVRQPSGLISPAKGQTQVSLSVLLSRFDARRIGLAMLEHLQAWAVNTYTARVASGTWQPEAKGPDLGPAGQEKVAAGEPPEAALRRYASGDPVGDNPTEVRAFDAYARAEECVPADVDALRAWVRRTGQSRSD